MPEPTSPWMDEVGRSRMPEPRATPGAVAYMDVGEEREQDAEALPREGGVD